MPPIANQQLYNNYMMDKNVLSVDYEDRLGGTDVKAPSSSLDNIPADVASAKPQAPSFHRYDTDKDGEISYSERAYGMGGDAWGGVKSVGSSVYDAGVGAYGGAKTVINDTYKGVEPSVATFRRVWATQLRARVVA